MALAPLNHIHSHGTVLYCTVPSVLINCCDLCWYLLIKFHHSVTLNPQAASKISLNLYTTNCRTDPVQALISRQGSFTTFYPKV